MKIMVPGEEARAQADLELLAKDEVELTATLAVRSVVIDLIETIGPIETHQTYHGRKMRTPIPAERFMSNGLKSLVCAQALPASMNPSP